ncbi:MAG: hypothetical protein J6C13_02285 [Clostridia bacterium]|nr:hypothetical protein [Clostridia bacterium]
MGKKNKDAEKQISTSTPPPTTVVKTVEKKRGGCGTFFLGFIFCFIFLVVTIGGVGIYMYYNVTLTQIENTLGLKLPIEGDIREKSLKDLVSMGLEYKDSITECTIESLNTDFGVDLPTTIPGTKLDITAVYNESVTFLGETKQVKAFRIQDIVNNLDAFVEVVLPKLYDHVTVGQVLETLQTTLLTDMGYPIFVDAYFNVGTVAQPNMKTLSQLTITQAMEQVPARFGEDNLTIQELINAFGLEIIPDPVEGETDIYASLRTLKITNLTTDDLTSKITGEILTNLIDLSSYEFTTKEAFKQTSLKDLGEFLLDLSLGEFVTLESVAGATETEQNEFFAKTQYANLAKDLKLNEVKDAIKNLKLNQIFSTTDIAMINSVYADAGNQTVLEFLTARKTALGGAVSFNIATNNYIDCAGMGGYVEVIGTSTADDFISNIDSASTFALLGGADNVTPIASICDLTLRQIMESENAVNLMLQNFTTLADLLGSESTGLFAVIGEVKVADLLNDPANAITEKLNNSTITLAEMFNNPSISADDKLMQTILNIQVGSLFSDPANSITNALSAKTLGEILNIDNSATGLISFLKDINFGDLLGKNGSSAQDVIINALTKDSNDNDITLGDFLEMSDTTGFAGKVANLKMSDLIGDSANPSTAISGLIDTVTLSDVFGSTTPENAILAELYALSSDNQGGMLVTEVFDNINQVKLSTVIGENKPGIFNLLTNYDTLTLETIDDMEFKTGITLGELIDYGVVTEPTTGAYDSLRSYTLEEIIAKAIAYELANS